MHFAELELDRAPAAAAPATLTAGVAGIGTALPGTVVSTAEVAAELGVDAAWIEKRTGILARRRLAADEGVSDLAIASARAALADAGLAAEDLDALIVATSRGDQVMPYTAPLVAQAIGATEAMAWDVGLACTGFLAALEQGTALIESARAGAVLVIAAEGLSRITDHSDRRTAALFGDGAGAAVLVPGGQLRVGASIMRAEGDEEGALVVGYDDPFVRMDGRAVFTRAVAGMERCCRELLAAENLTTADVDLVVPHQANARITRALRDRLALDPARVVETIADHGNTGGASIPLALAHVREEDRWPDSGIVLLTAFGAGFAMGATLLHPGAGG